ncbi:MAG: hypothetical protein JSR90_17610 [Proteobacteria bacterium]|nr:hypothetical protein [Pseudomonadota bacterium]
MTNETTDPGRDGDAVPEARTEAAPETPTAAASEASLLAQDAPPVAYESFRLPEGVALDADSMKSATELFAHSGLSQEQAQKFIDLAVSREQAAAQKGMQAFVDLQNKWVSEIKADPDIGGDKLTASLASASRAIDRLGVPGLREALNLTGAGNHPAVVKAFVRLGQMVSEDRFAPGKDAAPAAPRSLAEVIYDGNPRR